MSEYYFKDMWEKHQILDTSYTLGEWPGLLEGNWIPYIKFNLTDIVLWSGLITFWVIAVSVVITWYYVWEAIYALEMPDQTF